MSRAASDFIDVLLMLPLPQEKRMMYGRCPDCHEKLSGKNPKELVADILGHDCERQDCA